MTSTFVELLDRLRSHRGPVLTWYGPDRSELGGSVAARWLAKTANLLATDLSPDLFGSSETGTDTDTRLAPRGVLSLGLGSSWQAVMWVLAAWLSGWETTTEDSEQPSDVLVTDHIGEAALRAVEEGIAVLVQDTDPLALSWGGPALPEGALDALGALMAQPDGLLEDPDPDPTTLVEGEHGLTVADLGATVEGPPRVVLVEGSPARDARRILARWNSGASVVVVASSIDPAIRERLAAQERARQVV